MTQILGFDSTNNKNTNSCKPWLKEQAIEGIINQRSCQKLPILIVSISGPKRTGKSFLLNTFLCYLQALENVSIDC